METENKLNESEKRYRWIVEQVNDYIIYSMDKEGLITDWNKAAEVTTGYKRSEVIGKSHSMIYTVEDNKKDVPHIELKQAERQGKAVNERWHVGKDNTLFWGSGLVTPILDDNNKLRGYSKVMRDITTQIEREQKKDEFLSIASHELKTPVTSIKAYTQILSRRLAKSDDTQNAYFIKNIDSQTNKLVDLINDFLDISKIEAGKLVFHKKKFDLGALIDKIVIDFQFLTETHSIKKVGEINKDVFGDEDRIAQVLINLLTNAIKYSHESNEIIISLKQNTDHITISVQDFGIGISKNNQKDIFNKYFQINNKEDEDNKGFGLGLYISAEIIKRHKGKIWVESTKGKGSTFYFTLPISSKKR